MRTKILDKTVNSLKRCSRCGDMKPSSNFYDQKKKDGTYCKMGECKKCNIARKLEERKKNPEKYSERIKSPKYLEKAREGTKRYYVRHPDRRRVTQRNSMRKARQNLVGYYIRKILVESNGIPVCAISEEMISLKRELVQLHRIKKEIYGTIGARDKRTETNE